VEKDRMKSNKEKEMVGGPGKKRERDSGKKKGGKGK